MHNRSISHRALSSRREGAYSSRKGLAQWRGQCRGWWASIAPNWSYQMGGAPYQKTMKQESRKCLIRNRLTAIAKPNFFLGKGQKTKLTYVIRKNQYLQLLLNILIPIHC